jgi:HSP20 family molecular chaperone IbpA
LFGNVLEHSGKESNLTSWVPTADIYEAEHKLVVKADLLDMDPKDLDTSRPAPAAAAATAGVK